jgi:hypothetical protein
MNIVGVPREIRFISYRMFPEAPLPQRVFTFVVAFDRYAASDDLPGK